MCLAMIFGVIINTIIGHTRFKDSIDEHVEGRIGSMVTDYLVGFGVASISISIVLEFAGPILVMCIRNADIPVFSICSWTEAVPQFLV